MNKQSLMEYGTKYGVEYGMNKKTILVKNHQIVATVVYKRTRYYIYW